MHIILAVLGALVTILVLAHRLKDAGIDLGWLNPFHWHHRRKWKNKVSADPLFSITDPMEAAAVLLYATARLSGDISSEQKKTLIDIFERDFKLSQQEATNLLSSNAFLIKDEDKIKGELKKFLDASLENFSQAQKDSTLVLIDRVMAVEERVSPKQREFRAQIVELFGVQNKKSGTW